MKNHTDAIEIITPNWSAPKNIIAMSTCRTGGVSQAPFASLNLALHVNDNSDHVQKNRALLKSHCDIPNEPVWLQQTHSDSVTIAEQYDLSIPADASITAEKK